LGEDNRSGATGAARALLPRARLCQSENANVSEAVPGSDLLLCRLEVTVPFGRQISSDEQALLNDRRAPRGKKGHLQSRRAVFKDREQFFATNAYLCSPGHQWACEASGMTGTTGGRHT